MAKGIRERLLEQAAKFRRWQETTYPGKNAQEIGGEWEIDYPAWEDVWDAFCQVLTDFKAGQAEERRLAEMLYLIARDNEGEGLIQRTARHPAWFEALCRCAVRSPGTGSQMAVCRLPAGVPMQPGSQRPDPGFCKGLP